MIEIVQHRDGFIIRKPSEKYQRGSFGRKTAHWLYLKLEGDRIYQYWETHEDFATWFSTLEDANEALAISLAIHLSSP